MTLEIPDYHVPFKRYFKNRMLTGKKTATTRTKKYGERGDQFEAFGAPFVILQVQKVKLGEVAEKWYEAEGMPSPEAFIAVWKKLHPVKGYDPEQEVYLHLFARRNLVLATSSWPGHVLPESETVKW